MAFGPTTAAAQQAGAVLTTPTTPMELPIEVEIELSPAGSLKQALLWKEMYQLLKNPNAVTCPADNPATPFTDESDYCTSTIQRRPRFGAAGALMPPVNVYSLGYNFLTGQPLRLRTSDGEVSWDQPGPMFHTEEVVATDAFNGPTALRTPIGHLVACPNNPPYQAAAIPAGFCEGKGDGSLVVYNPAPSHPDIPPDGTVVAVAAFFDGTLHEYDPETQSYEELTELEAPINEEDFLRPTTDVTGVPAPLRSHVGRAGAEILGKALFWDMQVGSDGIQACGTCHFNAGVDNRTRGQLNPNTLGGDSTLQVRGPNEDVVASDFPFHKRLDPAVSGDGTNAALLIHDHNDVMSSMGVSEFKIFDDIPPIGNASFGPAVNGVRPLLPDVGIAQADPVPVNQGFRRVEPRNTPTFHGAAFNFDNFWDGRARFIFNGGSVFGPSDPTAHVFIDPGTPNGAPAVNLQGTTNGHLRPELVVEEPEVAEQPVRIKFSSLGSQAVGPPLSDFEMSFSGRNWAKIGKKLLQGDVLGFGAIAANEVTPLANQLVAPDDSRLGPYSNNRAPGSSAQCEALGAATAVGKPGLCISYGDLIRLAFDRPYWQNTNRHLNGCYSDDGDAQTFQNTPACAPGTPHDPFDGYVLTNAAGAAAAANTDQFRQIEANFSMFFALAAQAYEALTIPDDTPADRFFDANPRAGHGVGEPGDQAVLYPTLIPDLLDDGELNGTNSGTVTLVEGFGPDELFGFDLFAGANLTAALSPGAAVGSAGVNRNPQITNTLGQTIRVGSNPFTRSAKCMLCHLGPEQTDHSINISHGLLKNDAEFEYPTPPTAADPSTPATFPDGRLPAPEPSGSSRTVAGLIMEEEVGEGVAQDAVEVEPRNFATFDHPDTPWDDRIVAQESNFAFGDQGVYNIGLRPVEDDVGRGGVDGYGWPLSLAALTLKNIGGATFEPCDGPTGDCVMTNFDPENIEGENASGNPIAGQQGFEETGDGAFFPGTTHTLQSINPGFERDPNEPLLPEHLAPWTHSLPAGELHPQIDEMAGMVPNTVTTPNGGPAIEFPEVLFGADLHCASYNPDIFGLGPPSWGWGSPTQTTGPSLCPQHQSGVAGNFEFPTHGTWPVPNRVIRNGAFKAPALRNVELTGPYFHTGSYLTLRQVVDFYFRGGDFPVANQENRDPHIVDLRMQAFAFGPSQGGNLLASFDCSAAAPNDAAYPLVAGGCGSFDWLVGNFGDGLPDGAFLYDAYPDSNHPVTPETSLSPAAALEDAKAAIVKFLLALTDQRVKYERAPFDRPEIFVPIDGTAPENTGGRAQLLASSIVFNTPTPPPGNTMPFRQIPPVGAGGSATPVPAFLGVTNNPSANCTTEISHFCATSH
jgi:cytochrome c peroxidase